MVRHSEQSPNAADSARNPMDGNGLAIAGFVCAVIAIAYSWIPIFSFLIAPVWVCGAVFSSIGLARARRLDGQRKGLAVSGIVLTISAALLWVGMLLVVLPWGSSGSSVSIVTDVALVNVADGLARWGSSGSSASILTCDSVDRDCPATPVEIQGTGDVDLDVHWPGGTRLQLDFVGKGSCPAIAIVARSGSGEEFDPGFVGPSSEDCVEGLGATATLGADARHLEVRADGTWTIFVRN